MTTIGPRPFDAATRVSGPWSVAAFGIIAICVVIYVGV